MHSELEKDAARYLGCNVPIPRAMDDYLSSQIKLWLGLSYTNGCCI